MPTSSPSASASASASASSAFATLAPAVRATMGPTVTENSVGGIDIPDPSSSSSSSSSSSQGWKWVTVGAGVAILLAAGGLYLYRRSSSSTASAAATSTATTTSTSTTKTKSSGTAPNSSKATAGTAGTATTGRHAGAKESAAKGLKSKSADAKLEHAPSVDGLTSTPQPPEAVKPVEEMTHKERVERATYLKMHGNKLYTGQRYEKAIQMYTEALSVYPDPDENLAVFYSNRAACYTQLGQDDKVIEDCEAALKINPKYVKALHRRGQAFEKLGRNWESLLDYTTACIIDNFSKNDSMMAIDRVLKVISKDQAAQRFQARKHVLPSASFISAYIDSFREQPVLKISYADATTNNNSNNGEDGAADGDAAFKRAVTCIKQHHYPEALEALETAVGNNPKKYKTEAKLWRGTFYYLQARLDEAMKDLTEVIESPDVTPTLKANALIKRANVKLELIAPNFDQMDKVMADFEDALAVNDKDSDIYYHRGQLYFLMGDMSSAVTDYKKSVELCDTVPFAFVQLAVGYYRVNSVQLAVETFQKALQKFPDVAEVHNYYGEILLDQREYSKALNYFDAAVKLDPSNPLSFINKAILVFQENQDIDGAIKYAEKALEVDRKCDVAYAHLAQMQLQKGNLQAAIDNYDSATECSRTEADMANMISCREFARAQLEVTKRHPDISPPAFPAQM